MSHSLPSISTCSELRKWTTPQDNDSHPLLQLPVEIWTGFILPYLGVEESHNLLQTCRTLHYLVCQSLQHAYNASSPKSQRLLSQNIFQGHPQLFYRIAVALSQECFFSNRPSAFLKSVSPHTEQGQRTLGLRMLAWQHAWDQLRRRIYSSITQLDPLLALEGPPRPYTYGTFVAWCAQRVGILQARHLSLATIPEEVSRFTRLRECDLTHNLIPSIPPGLFAHLEQLNTLSLHDNLLQKLRPTTFLGMPRLQNIDLGSNFLSRLPSRIFSPLAQIKQIDLSDNCLSTLPSDCFLGLQQLIAVRLSKNQLIKIPPLDCPRLEVLDLDNNQLRTLPSDTFSNVPRLAIIDLSRNSLTECPHLNCPALERLFLQGNLLSTLPPDAFSHLQRLVFLDLSDNCLTSLPPGIFANLPNLLFLFLDNNPWQDLPLPDNREGGCIDLREIDLAQCSSAFRSLFEPSTS